MEQSDISDLSPHLQASPGCVTRACVKDLPVEVLREIFLVGYARNLPVDHYLWALLGVSRQWRQVITELLEVWTTIKVSDRSQLSPHFIETCLKYSRDQPISIRISLNNPEDQDAYLSTVIPLLVPHMYRWKVFDVQRAFNSDLIAEYSRFRGVAPHLERLDLDYRPDEHDDVDIPFPLDIHAPNLEKLQVICPLAWYNEFPSRFPALKNLILSHNAPTDGSTIPILLSMAASFPQLTRFKIEDISFVRTNDVYQYHLPNLQELVLHFIRACDMARMMSSFSAPKLLKVTFSNIRNAGTAGVLNIIGSRREHFPVLRTLAVIFDMPRGVNMVDDVLSAVPDFISNLVLFQSKAVDPDEKMAHPDSSGKWLCSGLSSLSISTFEVAQLRKMVEARLTANDQQSTSPPSVIRKLRLTTDISPEDPDLVWLQSHVDEVECKNVVDPYVVAAMFNLPVRSS